jgi:hypothetical protein
MNMNRNLPPHVSLPLAFSYVINKVLELSGNPFHQGYTKLLPAGKKIISLLLQQANR